MSKSGQWQWRPRDIGRGREKDSDGIVITEGWNRRGGYTDSRNGRQWTATRIAMVGAVMYAEYVDGLDERRCSESRWPRMRNVGIWGGKGLAGIAMCRLLG